MCVHYRVIAAHELDSNLLHAWHKIRSGNSIFSSPYFCPEFTQLVGKVRDDVRVVLIENDNRVAGFFPHQRSFLGMGKPIGGPLSDYHGVIAERDLGWEIESLMRAAKLSVWNFNHLVDDTGRFDPHVTAQTFSPLIDLSAGYTQYAKEQRDAGSDYIRKTEGLARKLGREFGELRFTLHEPGSEALEQLIRWKSAQYRDSRLPDAFAIPWTGDLLGRIAKTQASNFAGVCSVLRAGDRIVAIHFGMRSTSVLHYWFPAYDPEFAKFSPGIILLLRIAEALASIGVRIIDLGEGMSQYKQRLMNSEITLQKGAVELPSLLTTARQLQRSVEARATNAGIPSLLLLPLRAIRRIERTLKYR